MTDSVTSADALAMTARLDRLPDGREWSEYPLVPGGRGGEA